MRFREENSWHGGKRDENSPRTREWEEGNPQLEGGQTIVKAICQMREVVRQQIAQGQTNRQEPPRMEGRGCPFKKFLLYRYLNFMSTEGAPRRSKWLINLEMTFDINGCMEEQKVQYAEHLLHMVRHQETTVHTRAWKYSCSYMGKI